ncbi:uncharacterized protein [Hoplias malabaricus]|uniref:uncharacterized protein n=1 Tax=Hoplias malabaricus TaxID=27720 RepID=UPI0034621FC9
MSVRILLCFIVCFGETTVIKGGVTEIAPGSDVSLSCSSGAGQSGWKGPEHSNTLRATVKETQYLLIKDFQQQNVGQYECRNKSVELILKAGSTWSEPVVFRASEGDSVSLFCKDLTSSSLKSSWFWTPHGSGQNLSLGLDSTHFRNRLSFRNKDNDFSLRISAVDWSDSGRYECQRFDDQTFKKTSFELLVVRVKSNSSQSTQGDDAELKCEVSHQNQNIGLFWINKETKEVFPNPHQLKNVTMEQRNWECAVFNGSDLKALIPLTLNINSPRS